MNPIVHLSKDAVLRGLWKSVKTESGATKRVAAFLGVPYAQPPVNERRFAPPVPSNLWQGEREATNLGSFCPQDLRSTRATYFPIPIEDNQSEDCLYLNVWTPNLDKSAGLPVMVWIYGGAFVQGCSDYFNGTALAGRHDVIYISFNYRVGAFGFLCMNDDRYRGNMGFLDQIEALRWIQHHIKSFGGDPRNVTVFGESAGAISISMLLTSPLVKGQGLFKRAIMQSGSCFYQGCGWSPENAKNYAVGKLKAMNSGNITSGKDAVDFLQTKSTDEIVSGMGLGLLPVIDGALFTNRCSTVYEAGQFEPVEVIIGFNSFEGAFFVQMFLARVPELNKSVAESYLKSLVYKQYFRNHSNADRIYSLLYDEYLKDVTDTEQLHRAMVELQGDILFITPAIKHALTHCKQAKTYVYQFDHRPFFSRYPDWVTADHGQEIPYIIGEPFLGRVPTELWDEKEQQLSKDFMKYWTNFAKTGDPNGEGLARWPLYNETGREMLVIGSTPSTCSNFSPSRMSLWLDTIQSLASSDNNHKSQL